jgi:hypothetical protein
MAGEETIQGIKEKRSILRPYPLSAKIPANTPNAQLIRCIVDRWFLANHAEAGAFFKVTRISVYYWITGVRPVPRRVLRLIRATAAMRTAACRARLAQWMADENVQLELLHAAIRALPDPDERPYERLLGPQGGQHKRSDKRNRIARAEARKPVPARHGTIELASLILKGDDE